MRPTTKFILLVFLCFVVSFNACKPQTNTQTIVPSTTTPAYISKLGTVEKNIAYSSADFINLKMDVYYPLTAPGLMPVVVYLHGGAWIQGDKSDASISPEVSELVKRGFLVASINYGLAPQYTIPGQIENAKCAVRFLRANSSYFGIDSDKIGALGSSAGGHLASLLGSSDKSAGMDVAGGFLDQSSRVECVVDFYGPTDLRALFSGYPVIVLQELAGTSDTTSGILDKISPLTYVSADDPPFLILHGDKDNVVPLSQSQVLYQRLLTAGVPAILMVVKNGDHGFGPVGGPISPTRTDITATVADFFEIHLK
jgi:acetyl esterase/lipase